MPNRLSMRSFFDNLHEGRLTIPQTPLVGNGLLPSLSTTRIITPIIINYTNEAIKSLEDRKFRTTSRATVHFGHSGCKSSLEIVRTWFFSG
jgi:hypothetical protein